MGQSAKTGHFWRSPVPHHERHPAIDWYVPPFVASRYRWRVSLPHNIIIIGYPILSSYPEPTPLRVPLEPPFFEVAKGISIVLS